MSTEGHYSVSGWAGKLLQEMCSLISLTPENSTFILYLLMSQDETLHSKLQDIFVHWQLDYIYNYEFQYVPDHPLPY